MLINFGTAMAQLLLVLLQLYCITKSSIYRFMPVLQYSHAQLSCFGASKRWWPYEGGKAQSALVEVFKYNCCTFGLLWRTITSWNMSMFSCHADVVPTAPDTSIMIWSNNVELEKRKGVVGWTCSCFQPYLSLRVNTVKHALGFDHLLWIRFLYWLFVSYQNCQYQRSDMHVAFDKCV